jgi:hypothetical protein
MLTKPEVETAIEEGQMCSARSGRSVIILWPEALKTVHGAVVVVARTLKGKRLEVPLELLEPVANGVVSESEE